MPLLIKLFQAIVLGIIMVFSVMIITIFALAVTGFIMEMLGFKETSKKLFDAQNTMWIRMKRWTFMYKDLGEK